MGGLFFVKFSLHNERSSNGNEQTQNTNETLIEYLLISNSLHNTNTSSEKVGNTTKTRAKSYKLSSNNSQEEMDEETTDWTTNNATTEENDEAYACDD